MRNGAAGIEESGGDYRVCLGLKFTAVKFLAIWPWQPNIYCVCISLFLYLAISLFLPQTRWGSSGERICFQCFAWYCTKPSDDWLIDWLFDYFCWISYAYTRLIDWLIDSRIIWFFSLFSSVKIKYSYTLTPKKHNLSLVYSWKCVCDKKSSDNLLFAPKLWLSTARDWSFRFGAKALIARPITNDDEPQWNDVS